MPTNPACFRIGLTGGIASGKSAVSDRFAHHHCPIIDADIIAREVVQPNSVGLEQLLHAFGSAILTDKQHLDRAKLRQIVFNDKKKLATLNAILHPLIQSSILDQVQQLNDPYCIIVIPLLSQSQQYAWLDRVLVVDVHTEIQLQRLIKRDNISTALAEKMILSQSSREQRLSIADDVVRNENSLSTLYHRVDLFHQLYKNLKFL